MEDRKSLFGIQRAQELVGGRHRPGRGRRRLYVVTYAANPRERRLAGCDSEIVNALAEVFGRYDGAAKW